MPKSSILNQRCEQYESLHEHCYQRHYNLGPDGNQLGKRRREGPGEEKGECEAGEKEYEGMREIGKGQVWEEKVGWKER